MKILFLCGGVGKRMFPFTEDKLLLNFLGKTLLEHQIRLALEKGFHKFIFVCNHQNLKRIQDVTGHIPTASFEYAIQEKPLGIANALESAEHLLKEEFIIVNPNDIFDGSAYETLLNSRKQSKADSYVLGYKVKHYFPGGYLLTNERGELTHIIEKPGEGHEPSDMINILLHLHTNPKTIFNYFAQVKSDRDDVYESGLDAMCRDGKTIKVVPYLGNWVAIKYPWNILDAVRYFLDHANTYISPSAQVSERAVITGKVIIEDDVRILENAVIRGPVYIGPKTIIGNSTLTRAYSHIGADCVVGFGTEIKGSYVDNGTGFHMSYCGDSIVGKQCNFGAGTITANWRFDEKPILVRVNGIIEDTGTVKFGAIIGNNCRIGINVSIMPGVKIGPDVVIGPAQLLIKDVKPSGGVEANSIVWTSDFPNNKVARKEC